MKTNRLLIVLVLIVAISLTSCSSRARVGALRTESKSIEQGDAESVRVEVEFGAGNLQVSGGAEKLLEADFNYNVAKLKPEVTYKDGRLVVKQPATYGLPSLRRIADFRNEWDLRLSNDVPMALTVNVGGGTSSLNLAGLSLTGLDVNMGAGDGTIDLSGEWMRNLNAAIDVGGAITTIRLPGNVGARVEVDAGPTVVDAPDMTRDGGVYTNAAYGESAVSLYINIKAGIGVLTLEVVDEAAASNN